MSFKSTEGRDLGKELRIYQSDELSKGLGSAAVDPVNIATPTVTFPSASGSTSKILEVSDYSGGTNYGATNIIYTYNNGTNFDNENTAIYSLNDESAAYVYIPDLPSNNSDVAAKVQYINAIGESVIGPPIQFQTTTDYFAGSKGGTEYGFVTQLEGDIGVLNAFDGSASTYFGPTSGGRNPSTTMIWNFSNGWPLSSGDTFQTQGFAGGGFQATITLANGQTSNIGQTITVSSNTRISKFQCGLWGNADQYSRISGFKINGVTASYRDV